MDKEEILRKSREQKEDEGLIQQENIGRQYGVYGLTLMIVIYVLIDISIGGSINAPMSMWFAFLRSSLLIDLVKIIGY